MRWKDAKREKSRSPARLGMGIKEPGEAAKSEQEEGGAGDGVMGEGRFWIADFGLRIADCGWKTGSSKLKAQSSKLKWVRERGNRTDRTDRTDRIFFCFRDTGLGCRGRS